MTPTVPTRTAVHRLGTDFTLETRPSEAGGFEVVVFHAGQHTDGRVPSVLLAGEYPMLPEALSAHADLGRRLVAGALDQELSFYLVLETAAAQ